MTTDRLSFAFESQLREWPAASAAYASLAAAEIKRMDIGGFSVRVLHNPARIRSTAAKVDVASVRERGCFLCPKARPAAQQVLAGSPAGFELLVNPYPILNPHFTIVSRRHEPQTAFPAEMVNFAVSNPGYTAFFNGAKAGASAPDHLHFQAVRTVGLPLMEIVEAHCGKEEPESSSAWNAPVPFLFFSAETDPASPALPQLVECMRRIAGIDPDSGRRDHDLVNCFAWIGADGRLRIVVVPRRRHRPACFFLPEPERMLVSPGALDIAGLIVTPRKEDFERISPSDILDIYRQTTLQPDSPV